MKANSCAIVLNLNPSECLFKKRDGYLRGEAFGVRRVLAVFRRRLVAAKSVETNEFCAVGRLWASVAPLGAALLGRQVGQVGKAATSRHTPKRGCAFSGVFKPDPWVFVDK